MKHDFFSAVFLLNFEGWGEEGIVGVHWPGKRSGHSLIYVIEDLISSIDQEERDDITLLSLSFIFFSLIVTFISSPRSRKESLSLELRSVRTVTY